MLQIIIEEQSEKAQKSYKRLCSEIKMIIAVKAWNGLRFFAYVYL